MLNPLTSSSADPYYTFDATLQAATLVGLPSFDTGFEPASSALFDDPLEYIPTDPLYSPMPTISSFMPPQQFTRGVELAAQGAKDWSVLQFVYDSFASFDFKV